MEGKAGSWWGTGEKRDGVGSTNAEMGGEEVWEVEDMVWDRSARIENAMHGAGGERMHSGKMEWQPAEAGAAPRAIAAAGATEAAGSAHKVHFTVEKRGDETACQPTHAGTSGSLLPASCLPVSSLLECLPLISKLRLCNNLLLPLPTRDCYAVV